MKSKKAAAPQKAKISAKDLESFMHLEKGHDLKLAPYCDAAKDVCNAFAQIDLEDSHVARMSMLHCAVWLHTAKVKTVEQMRDLPLTVRYMVLTAKEEQEAVA